MLASAKADGVAGAFGCGAGLGFISAAIGKWGLR
jgi:hypothetical protein